MSATTIKDIRALIAAKLATLLDTDNESIFGAILEYASSKFDEYPAVTILPTGGSQGEMKDTGRNIRVFSFDVSIYQEQTNAGKTQQEANTVMTDICDRVLQAFDQDRNFNFEVSRVRVADMAFNYKVAAGTFIFATFKIDCEVVVPNYST